MPVSSSEYYANTLLMYWDMTQQVARDITKQRPGYDVGCNFKK